MYKSVLLFLLHCTPVVIINEFNETEGEIQEGEERSRED